MCGRIHDRAYECSAKKKAKLDKSRRDRSRLDNKIYSSNKWRKLRDNIMDDYNSIDLFSYYIFGRVEVAETVHHIVEICEDIDLAYDWDNLIPLSNYIHRPIVHKLYKTNVKNDIVIMLNDILEDWKKGNKELGSYRERYNKIVKELGMNI
ncbi:TPA: hypothetical protein LA457_000372 [Clostridium botulinum]|nr:hypothetical protein [Clostridium botulinum]